MQDTEYEFRVSATVTIGGRQATVKSAPLTTTTMDALALSPPIVVRRNGTEAFNPAVLLKDFEWFVLDAVHARLGPTTWGRETNRGRYRFAFHVPQATEVQIGTRALHQHSDCDWGTWPSRTSTWNEWNSDVQLVVCGVGNGTSSITLKVRNTAHDNYTWDAMSIPVKQAWHDADGRVEYQIDCMPAPSGDLNYRDGIRKGAIGWSGHSSLSFARMLQNGCVLKDRDGLVTVEIYTSTTHKNDPCDSDAYPPGTIFLGCVLRVSLVQPHLVTQTLFINGDIQWSSDADEDGVIDPDTHYLPEVMMHEFGHTAGLGHSANPNDLMSKSPALVSVGVVTNALTPNDISAMKSMYPVHAGN